MGRTKAISVNRSMAASRACLRRRAMQGLSGKNWTECSGTGTRQGTFVISRLEGPFRRIRRSRALHSSRLCCESD